jgi:hypothetical protein
MPALGDAWVGIGPDLQGFGPALKSKLAAAIRAMGTPSVPVTADMRQAAADLAKFQAALKAAGGEIPIGLDVSKTSAAVQALLTRMRAAGLTDFLDVSLPLGRIQQQLILLRRLMSTAGVTDFLSVDLNKAQLAEELATISQLTETIPVNFDVSHLPVVGPVGSLTEHINEVVNTGDAATALAALGASETSAGDDAQASAAKLLALAAAATSAGDAAKLAYAAQVAQGIASRQAGNDTDSLTKSVAAASLGTALLSQLWTSGSGILWGLTGKVTLFGGALAGIPMLGAISGWHLMTEAILETAAVVIPATVALVAFGAEAAPAVQHIGVQLQNVWTAANALNTSVGPLQQSMFSLNKAVTPEVYQLFGEALVVAARDAGGFSQVAAAAGQVLVQLGARAAVALTSGGMGTFLKEGPADLAMIGDIIGNIAGTVGNILRQLPGYAQILLSALDDVTRAIEAVTGSTLGQWLIGAGLAFHGAVVWIGLAVTAVTLLSNALLGLAGKVGLVDAGMTVFNAEQFGAGIRLMLGSTVGLGAALFTMAGGEDAAAAASGVLTGAMAALDAVNPVVWIGLAAVALGVFIDKMVTATSAAQSYVSSVQQALSAAPVTSLAADLAGEQAAALSTLAGAQEKLAGMAGNQVADINNMSAAQRSLASAISPSVQEYDRLTQSIADQKALLPSITADQASYNAVLRAAGGSTQVLNTAGITSAQILGANAEQLKQLEVMAEATVAQQDAFATSTGRVGAVMNALNYAGDTTLNMLGSWDVDMAKVVQGQDAMTSVILGGEQAFLSFQDAITGASAKLNTPPGLANAAAVAGASIGGLNAQSQALANSFYNDSIPAFQKLIDSTEMQLISTGDLTKVVATAAGQMTPYIGANVEARSVIVAMINDALGPNTVSLQTLNKWIANNSTSLTGFNAIIAKSTIAAGTLANVLQTDLNAQFAAALLKSSGADQAISALTEAITHGGTQTEAYRSARQQLIQDLENTGLTATQAKNYVSNLQNQINALHGKTVPVGTTLSGSGHVTVYPTPSGAAPSATLYLAATGGLVKMGTGPTADDVPALLSKGETVVSAADSKKLAGAFKAIGVPGYASGGLASVVPWTAAVAGGDIGKISQSDLNTIVSRDLAAMKAYEQKKAQAAVLPAGGLPIGGGPLSSSAAVAQAFAKSILWAYGWTMAQWPYELALWNKESGWNAYAVNPSSGAAGIPQNINGWAAYAPGDYQAQIRWGDAYISGRYGSPAGAWAHEVAYNWYDKGGVLPPGLSLAWNGTGRGESVTPGGGTPLQVTLEISTSGSGTFDSFLLTWIKNNVRVKGGGNVQAAFGRNL